MIWDDFHDTIMLDKKDKRTIKEKYRDRKEKADEKAMDNMMDNVFKKEIKRFEWSQLGNISLGRGNLGEEMPVMVYRLMLYTLLDILRVRYGSEDANDIFRDAGRLAGTEFAKNVLNMKLNFIDFVSHLQDSLKELKIGILRMELFDQISGEIVFTVAEDLDCSGLPVTGENVCVYDEGFIAGILEVYTGKKYKVKEIDCWASGNRICRFQGFPNP